MPTKSIASLLIMIAFALAIAFNNAEAGNVSVNVNGYLPAPPGVNIQIDAGRPYYVESNRRVYMEKEKPSKHNKKGKKHHDNGNKNGHGKNK